MTALELEKCFHRHLQAAEHNRQSPGSLWTFRKQLSAPTVEPALPSTSTTTKETA